MLLTGDYDYLSTGLSPREESEWGSPIQLPMSLRTGIAFCREGNGTPLQCSCLENPSDGGAWWAAVSGVSQSRTRLKRLSSSSNCLLAGFPRGSAVENLPTVQETWVPWVQSLDREDPLEKEMTTHSSILAWKIPGTEELVGYSPWGCKELDMT